MARRALAGLALLPGVAAAAAGFPPTILAGGAMLVCNGTGSRRYWGIEVYRAALYLPRPVQDGAAVLAAPGPWAILLRYARAVPADLARRAWTEAYAANTGGPPPEPLLDWVRTAAPETEECYAAGPEGARLSGPGRPDAILPGAAAARALLATWLGPAPPTEALKRGLLGAA